MNDFLEYLFGRLKSEKPVTHLVGDQAYAVKVDGTLGEPVRKLAPQWRKPTLQLSSLDGLVSAYKAKLDGFPTEVALHVVNHLRVDLIALSADDFGHRHIWAIATHSQETLFKFGEFYEPEMFLIAFRSSFFFNDSAEKVARLSSTISHESSVAVADDGISQAITVKDGAVTRTTVELPPEIPLIPWRTFREANPVESKFLLRMKGVKDQLPRIAIFEIDAKWRLDTVVSIAAYLAEQLPEATIIV